ncbi:MAG: hypothetical protein EPO09_21030 [Aquabacterium sp.]|uniref:PEP-CTERM sorting domain-containing protein n=1 Tax=Aquabacterium sp. TaxID=1872578 RepID=UPI00121723E2|nr:PEP-CTERM sorting domain-containing protein [Aquabacterium sp.]TAK84219.1 MAG: hypothetical protein EPO09_21030 [Aquabacterium sp.]
MKHFHDALPRVAAACAVLLGTASCDTWAQLAPTSPSTTASVLTSFPDGQLNHWYVSQSSTIVGVAGESAGDDAQMDNAFLGLAKQSMASVAGEYDTASAFAAVGATTLKAAAFSTTSDSFAGLHSMSYAIAGLSYVAVMDQPGTVTMDLHLSGLLYSRSLGATAAMNVVAIGSGVDDGTLASLDLASNNQDLDPLQTIRLLPQINEAHAQVFNAIHDDAFDGTWTFDKNFSVSAEGQAFACPEVGAGRAYCGKYLYAFSLGLATATLNNADADFAHTLTVTGLQLPEGATLTFESGAAIPVSTSAVPEASTLAMSLIGLCLLAGVTTRRRQRA